MRSSHRYWSGLLSLAAGLVAFPAAADMRCSPHVVTRGLTIPEVLERCGAPVYEAHRIETIAPDVWVAVDEFIYEQGGNKFRRLLRFENGRLDEIEVLAKPIVPLDTIETPY
jgi:hypothetical protein